MEYFLNHPIESYDFLCFERPCQVTFTIVAKGANACDSGATPPKVSGRHSFNGRRLKDITTIVCFRPWPAYGSLSD